MRFLARFRLDGAPAAGDRAADAFFGSLPGTFAVLIQRADGVVMAALFNQRADPSGLDYAAIRPSLDRTADSIQQWPRQ